MTVSTLTPGDARTWIYFIQEGENGPIKIGIAKNPDERLATLQQANSARLHGLTAVRADPAFERRLHRAFAHAHIRGEWFRSTPALVALWEFFALHDFESWWFRAEMPPEVEEFVFACE